MKKILIVDDAETVRSQLRKELETAGYLVIDAADGILGIEAIEREPDVALVISDVNMPRMDGLTMSKKIHEKENFKSVPIIVMTTESSLEMKTIGKEAGVLAWITKPYDPTKLLAALKKILK